MWFDKKIEDCVVKIDNDDTIAGGTVFKVVDQSLITLIEKYVQLDVCKMRQHKPGRFPGSVPISAFKTEIYRLTEGKELHAEKIRGTRYKFIALKLVSSLDLFGNSSSSADSGILHTQHYNTKNSHNTVYSDINIVTDSEVIDKYLPDTNIVPLIGNKKKYKKRTKLIVRGDEGDDDDADADNLEDEDKNDDNDDNDNEEGPSQSDTKIDDSKEEDVTMNTTNTNDNNDSVRKIVTIQYLNAFMNRKNDIFILPHVMIQEAVYPCVLDGELALHIPTQKYHYLVFGISLSNGFLYTDFSYQDRVYAYYKLIETSIRYNDTIDPLGSGCIFIPKPQFPWYQFDKVYARMKSGNYSCDGIVATINQARSVEYGTDTNSYKIKLKDEHTSDLIVKQSESNPHMVELLQLGYLTNKTENDISKYDKRYTQTLKQQPKKLCESDKLYSCCTQLISETFRIKNDEELKHMIENSNEWSNYLYECLWNPETKKFIVVSEKRTDKAHPNNARTIEYIKKNIEECMTPDDVLEMWKFWKQNRSKRIKLNHEFVGFPENEYYNRNSMMEIHPDNNQLHKFWDDIWWQSHWRHADNNTAAGVGMSNDDVLYQVSQIDTLSWLENYYGDGQENTNNNNNNNDDNKQMEFKCPNIVSLSKLFDVKGLKPVRKLKRKPKKTKVEKKKKSTRTTTTTKAKKTAITKKPKKTSTQKTSGTTSCSKKKTANSSSCSKKKSDDDDDDEEDDDDDDYYGDETSDFDLDDDYEFDTDDEEESDEKTSSSSKTTKQNVDNDDDNDDDDDEDDNDNKEDFDNKGNAEEEEDDDDAEDEDNYEGEDEDNQDNNNNDESEEDDSEDGDEVEVDDEDLSIISVQTDSSVVSR